MVPALTKDEAPGDVNFEAERDTASTPRRSEDLVAEIWMGTHPRGPSYAETSPGTYEPLTEVLGRVGARELPFLFKILTAERGLSIQTHPSQALAREGFQRETAEGIDRGAPHRMYRDRNHKPELLCAVDDFWGLRGFRPLEELQTEMQGFMNVLQQPAADTLRGALQVFVSSPTESTWREAFAALLQSAEGAARAAVVSALQTYCGTSNLGSSEPKRDNRYWWCRELLRQFPGDLGAAAPLYLNLVHLNPGEAIFLEAGVLHAYLYGAGVELMAASDNVLRAGCTSKHVDRRELLRALGFVLEPAAVLSPAAEMCGDGRMTRYRTSADEFELLRYALPPGVNHGRISLTKSRESVAVVLSLGTTAGVFEEPKQLPAVMGRSVELSSTEAAVVDYGTDRFMVELHAGGVAYVAGVPGAITCTGNQK